MIEIKRVDFSHPLEREHFCELLNHYASDTMGGGEPLSPSVLERVCSDLEHWPGAVSFIAFETSQSNKAVGLINCFLAYSTFKAKPILNIHDIVVRSEYRGQGVSKVMLEHVEEHAKQQGCCKLTLEVLTGNAQALRAYQTFGFENYQLLADQGHAVFLQKWIA